MTADWPSAHAYSRTKAYLYTGVAYAVLILILFLRIIRNTPDAVALQEDAIEVNLGDADEGYGDIPPDKEKSAGDPAAASAAIPAPPSSSSEEKETIDEAGDESVAARIQPKKKEVDQKKIDRQIAPAVKPSKDAPQRTAPEKEPTSQKPLALFRGSPEEESVKADASSYDSYGKEGSSQGIKKGKGDMGSPHGTISSNNYGSVSVVGGLGNRKIKSSSSLTEDFNSEGIVQIRVTFNRRGDFVSVIQDVAGSTTTKRELVDIAFRQAKKIALNEDENAPLEQVVTFRFIFKINL